MNSPRPTPSTDDPIATQLAQIWRDALGEQTIAASDSFFDLGGNSLLALQVIGRVNHTFGISIGPTDLLTQPTFAELTQLVTTQMLGKTESSEVDAIMAELALMSDEDAQKLLDAL